jgi:hypothetical protein
MNKNKTIGIIGTRTRDSGDDFDLTLKAFKSIYKSGDRICSGGCPKGGDRFADTIAKFKKEHPEGEIILV